MSQPQSLVSQRRQSARLATKRSPDEPVEQTLHGKKRRKMVNLIEQRSDASADRMQRKCARFLATKMVPVASGGRTPLGKKKRTCKHEGCTNIVVNVGACIRHGAGVNTCSHERCTNKGSIATRFLKKSYLQP